MEEAPIAVVIISLVLSFFSALISIFLLFIIIKSKVFYEYSFYYIIIFNVIFTADNIIRIIPFGNSVREEPPIFCNKIQAILLIFFNKLELLIITMQIIIYYLGVKTNIYVVKKKLIFWVSFIIIIIVSSILTIIIIFIAKLKVIKYYCYIGDVTREIKIIEYLFHGILFLINCVCLLPVICFLRTKKREAESGQIEDLDYKHHLCKMITLFILSAGMLGFSVYFNLANEKNVDFDDIIFVIYSFILDLVFCINRALVKETLKIFCKKTYKEKFGKVKSMKLFSDIDNYEDNEEEDEEYVKGRTTSCFFEK